jgi:regulatory protein
MLVTEIVPFKKSRSKVLTDGDFAFVLYNGELKKLRISEGAEITEEKLNGTILPLLNRRARERVVYLLKDMDKTEAELKRKLREACYPESCIEAAVSWAREKHYVDDERFASGYAEYHSAGKSRKKLLYDMILKGVPREIAEKTLEAKPVDEEEQIRRELAKRRYDPETADIDAKRKMTAFLARKGYSWDMIGHILNR